MTITVFSASFSFFRMFFRLDDVPFRFLVVALLYDFTVSPTVGGCYFVGLPSFYVLFDDFLRVL